MAAGTKGAGRVGTSGVGVGIGVCVCVLVTATAVTRPCARLRSMLRWLTRRLEALARAVGRGAATSAGGTHSRYTSIVAKECWESGLIVPRAASVESRVAEAPYGAYRQVPSTLRDRMEYRG